jgi:hypothetical protein
VGEAQGKSSQPKPESIVPLLAPLQALQDLLVHFNNQGVIIGGIAASLLGTPRYTVDLDAVFLLSFDHLPKLLDEAEKRGIKARIADPIGFARTSHVILLRHESSGTDIYLSLGTLPFEEEMVERSQIFDLGVIKLRLPTPEDLIIMKAVAHRPKDLFDIQAIAASHPDLDRRRIRFWLDQFGEALDMPDLWEIISALL